MQFYRCKCGNATAWSSMGIHACTTCKKCGSDLANGPEGHAETPPPHEYAVEYDENTGAPYGICRVCLKTRAKIEAPLPPDPPPTPLPDMQTEANAQHDGPRHALGVFLDYPGERPSDIAKT